MDDSLIFQYAIIAVIILFAGYSSYKFLKKNFGPKKFKKNGKPGCDSDCCG